MMTDKRRHSIADGLTPEVKDKKKWSIESFSPLNIGATLHSKWKKKSTERIHPALKKHADDHDLFVKTSVSSRYNRRASVAVVSSETNSQLLLPDKLSCHHHGSVLSLWKKKMQTIPEPTGSPEMERRPTAAMYKRRASIAVTQLNTDHPVTFKPHKVKGKKGSKEYFMAVVHLHSGRSGVLTGEDGPGIESLLNQATMDQRINSYRLIMASTRAILDHDGTPKTPCVDPELDDVFEELGLQENPDSDTETDHRCEIVNDLLRTEREYGCLLGSILNTYAEPLRKFSSLTAEDHKVLFVGVEPVLSISAMLTSKLEDVLKTWVSSSSQIGNLFTSKFWNLYEEYLKNYSNTRKLLEDCYTSDQSFLEFCNVRKGQTTHKLESLLHLPVSSFFTLFLSISFC